MGYILLTFIITNINSPKEWPPPDSVHTLCGFLGLHYYASSASLLTLKDQFYWPTISEEAFNKLKISMIAAPVQALPDFSKRFVIECDACGSGIGAVLMQDGHPIAYLSQALHGHQLHMSTYEKELFALVFSIKK